PPALPPLPTRRSSDLVPRAVRTAHRGVHRLDGGGVESADGLAPQARSRGRTARLSRLVLHAAPGGVALFGGLGILLMGLGPYTLDRKSTRLNSSHVKT